MKDSGASWRGAWSSFGEVKQNWAGEKRGGEDDPRHILEAGKNKPYAAVLISTYSLAACVNGLVQLPPWLL